jgi:hypothetical protein
MAIGLDVETDVAKYLIGVRSSIPMPHRNAGVMPVLGGVRRTSVRAPMIRALPVSQTEAFRRRRVALGKVTHYREISRQSSTRALADFAGGRPVQNPDESVSSIGGGPVSLASGAGETSPGSLSPADPSLRCDCKSGNRSLRFRAENTKV